MKKLLSILLATILIITAMPLSVFNFTASAATEGYYTYSVSNGEATITDVDTSISGDVTIPSTLGGYPVTSIGSSAFEYYSFLTSVTIPDSVTSIGSYAFYGCANLTDIILPDSVRRIGSHAFAGTAELKNEKNWINNILYIGNHLISAKDNLRSCEIKEGTITLADYSFAYCSGLLSITLPSSVKSIGDSAFFSTSISNVYYQGNEDDKTEILISQSNNGKLNRAKWYYEACINSATHTYDNACDTICDRCNFERAVPNHVYDDEFDVACNICGDERKLYTPGDINDDGEIALTDVVTLAQVVAQWQGVEHNTEALDVNGDGEVTLQDVVHLSQYVAKWQNITLH